MIISLPSTSSATHVVTVYLDNRYVREYSVSGRSTSIEIDDYSSEKNYRIEHAPGDGFSKKGPPHERHSARLDGVWFPYEDVSPNYGLPALPEPEPEVTDTHPSVVDDKVDVKDDDTQEQADSPPEQVVSKQTTPFVAKVVSALNAKPTKSGK